MSNPLADGFEKGKAIFVTSIDINVQEAHLKQFFSFCGAISKLKFLNYTLASPFKACLIEFKDSSAIDTALMLNNTELLGRVIRILPSEAAEAVPASADDATLPPPVDIGATPFPLLPMPTVVPPHLMMMMGMSGLPFAVLPPVVPPTAIPTTATTTTTVDTAPILKNSEMSNQQSSEELNRTVYVGNIAAPVTQVELARHMGSCGPVTFTRISGGSSNPADPSRYAFVEYATVEAARTAVERLNGSLLIGMSLRVSNAKNPIVKPALPAELLPSAEAKRKVKHMLASLEARLKRRAEGENSGDSEQQNEASNGHARERDRSRSPRR